MRKYYYYTYVSGKDYGDGVSFSDNGCFDIYGLKTFLNEKYGNKYVVNNIQEISSEQYEKLKDYFENQNK